LDKIECGEEARNKDIGWDFPTKAFCKNEVYGPFGGNQKEIKYRPWGIGHGWQEEKEVRQVIRVW